MLQPIAKKKRVIVYVDGFNFYYGLKDAKWKKFYWLDMVKFFDSMMRPDQELVEVNYFSAVPYETAAAARQDLFFKANKENPRFNLYLGKYLRKELQCRNCQYIIKTYEEKETDVRVAIKMLEDVFFDRCDITIVVSADSDMGPSIDSIKTHRPMHQIYAYFPPNHYSASLTGKCNSVLKLSFYKSRFAQAMLPEEVALSNGYVAKRPENWK